ncbi:hypothetical protein [uncultured Desulfobacter sp.]|uniref:hypothetical protein n=1 Tax=uncultured Desulfobacter sp. TaxID=240139 RepID=UPI0029F45F94|nr:hypothetical protein [uncultured Desulfobacter sp.]
MKDEDKSKAQLIKELHETRKRIAVLERNNTKEYHNEKIQIHKEAFEIINESSMSVIVWRNIES